MLYFRVFNNWTKMTPVPNKVKNHQQTQKKIKRFLYKKNASFQVIDI